MVAFRPYDTYLLLIGTACRAHVFETACRAHDIYHLLLIGTAKIHTEPIHIVVYGQRLAALMIFTIHY